MSHDTVIHRIVRPAVRLVAKTPITPDHLTVLRFASGVVAALCFATGWIFPGSLVFLLSALLDRADGELARATNKFSQHGHRYDLIADWSAGAMTFVGLGLGARDGMLGLAAPLLGVLAAIGVTVLFWGINVLSMPALPRDAGGGGRVLLDPDDAMFLIVPLLWGFGAEGVLLPAGTITPVLAGLMLFRLWRLGGLRRARSARADAFREPDALQ